MIPFRFSPRYTTWETEHKAWWWVANVICWWENSSIWYKVILIYKVLSGTSKDVGYKDAVTTLPSSTYSNGNSLLPKLASMSVFWEPLWSLNHCLHRVVWECSSTSQLTGIVQDCPMGEMILHHFLVFSHEPKFHLPQAVAV